MPVKGEIFITADGSVIEGPRDNNSSLIFEFKNKLHFPFNDDGMLGDKEMSLFSIVKDIDKITPQLYKIVDKKIPCDEILIKLYRIAIDTGEEEEYLHYKLKDALILSVENWMHLTKIDANEDIGHLEKIEIISDWVIVTYLDGGIETEIHRSAFNRE